MEKSFDPSAVSDTVTTDLQMRTTTAAALAAVRQVRR
jgi:hypothetical protein